MPIRLESLTARLLAGALVWLALMLGAGGLVLTHAFRSSVENTFVERLDGLLRAMVASVEPQGDTVRFLRPLGEPRFELIYSGWYWQIAEQGRILARSRSLWDEALPIHPGGEGTREVSTVDGPGHTRLLMVERDLAFPGATRALHIQVAADGAEVNREVARFGILLAASLGLMGLGLLVAVVIQVRFGLRPLRLLVEQLDQVRSGARARLGDGHPTEIAPLVQAMNAVLDHDAELIERARTHVGNLAHGLKTPLSVINAAADDPGVVTAQVQAMTRMVEHHLARAGAATGSARALGARVPVTPVLDELRRALARIHADRDLDIAVAATGSPAFAGERQDLEEILGNLMDNACKWARSRVRAHAVDIKGGLLLTVEDDGPGMSEEDAALASARGTRLDEMTPGWGLGLSIVADLAALHGGRLEFGRSELGGLKVALTFAACGAA